MPLLVMKFGGTSVADLDRIKNAAQKVQREVDRGYDVIVIVSAMSGKTNELVGWVKESDPLYDPSEYDAVVASGEMDRAEYLATATAEWRALDAADYPFIHHIVDEFAVHDDRDQFFRIEAGEGERALDAAEMRRTMGAESKDHWLWTRLRTLAEPRRATVVLMVTALLLGIATWLSRDLRTGDLGHGIPELHEDARYNQDAAAIVESFSIGVDVLSVIVQSRGVDGACTNFDIMDTIDRFETTMRGVHGVQSVVGLPGVAKTVNAGWNEGNPAWRVLSRNPTVLAQSVTPVDTSTGLLNTDCSAMQVLIFTRDHEGATISHVIREVKAFRDANRGEHLDFLLASGNVGVMAATNEAVDAASVTILVLVFGVISVLFFLEFRSWRATLCIILPLMIAAVFCNALMALLGIGLKVSTLPVVAIAVGIGVDYGIYFYERMSDRFRKGDALPDAFYQALCQRGTAVMFTATTMSVGVGT